MYKRRLIFCVIALIALFGTVAGYRFYENRIKPIPVAQAIGEGLASTDRAFLRQTRSVSQLPREITNRFPSLTPPAWTHTPEVWDSDVVDSIKAPALAMDVVGIHATKLPDGKVYRLPLPKEKTLIEGDVISDKEIIFIFFTTPENTPDFPRPSEEESPVPYPLIAKFLNEQDDTSLMEFGNWIKSVGGAARAQSLLEAAGVSDSIRIETATIFRQ